VTGPTCDSEDTLFLDVLLPDDLRPDDRLYIGSAGAYTTAYASRFNGFEIPRTHVLGQSAMAPRQGDPCERDQTSDQGERRWRLAEGRPRNGDRQWRYEVRRDAEATGMHA
jgi:hypothetical protein